MDLDKEGENTNLNLYNLEIYLALELLIEEEQGEAPVGS